MVTAVGLEVQPGIIVAVATATDPQNTENLRDVVQSIGVFPSATCDGATLNVEDDLAGSGIEETFGTVVSQSTHASLYAAISTAQQWPVELRFQDRDGNRTVGRVLARIIR